MFEQLGLIGCGLMGGSFALALKRAGLVKRVVGYSKSPSTTERARPVGVIDVEAPSALLAVSGADIVLLAVPVAATEATLKAIRHLVTSDMLIMDVGSTKRDVIDAARRVLRDHVGSFVPCHPIAGKEVSGVEHADPDLYTGKQVILTPIDRTQPVAAEQAVQVWEGLGCKVLQMTPDAHDAAFAAVSHLPHLIAFALDQRASPRRTTARTSCRWPARAFAISRASPPATPRCGATSCWPTGRNCWSRPRSSSARCRPWKQMIEGGNGEALEDLIDQASQARAHWRMGSPGNDERPARDADVRHRVPGHSAAGQRRRARCCCPAPRASPTACCCWPR